MRRYSLRGAAPATLAFAVIGGLSGCGDGGNGNDGMSTPVANCAPGVKLTATSPEGNTTSYYIEFHWTAWDDDGKVDYCLYCVDPPDSAGVDTLWQMTKAYSARLTFASDVCDARSHGESWNWRGPLIGVGYHIFVIRAVDDLGAMSTPDYLAFNATTLCPKTYIYSPPPCCEWNEYQAGPQDVGLRVTFRWEGEDPDGVFTSNPVGYLYKLTDVTGESDWKHVATSLRDDPAPWVEAGPETTEVTLDLDGGRAYGFGVRAIDEANAVDPLLLLNKNLLWIHARGVSSFPDL